MTRMMMLRTTALFGLALFGGVACDENTTGPDTEQAAMSVIAGRTLVQVDRMALPAINTAFVSDSDTKNAFNGGTPATDEDRFLGTLTQTIMTRYGLNSSQATALADFVLPDALPLGDLSGFPNGRRFPDDVIDIELGLIFGVFGPAVPALQSDGVDANDRDFERAFPHLSAPRAN